MTFKILSLDGGGIRGVLSATILKQVETTIQEKTGQKLHEYFDLISGTSTGSILVAAIACQMNVEQMIDFYLQYSGQFFKRDAMASASNAYAIKHRSEKSECNLNPK